VIERAGDYLSELFKVSVEDVQTELSKLNPIEPVEVDVKIEIREGSVHFFESGNTSGERARERILTILKQEMLGNLSGRLKEELSKEGSEFPLVSLKTFRLNDSTIKVEELSYSFEPSLDWMQKFKNFIMWFGWGNKLSWWINFSAPVDGNCLAISFKDSVSGRMEIEFPTPIYSYTSPGRPQNYNLSIFLPEKRLVSVDFVPGYVGDFSFCWETR